MRAVVTRVSQASVTVDGEVVGAIGAGLLVLLGIEDRDGEEDIRWLSGKIVNLRIFTLGAVVKPGDPVMDLVPEHDRLIAEVNIQPYDIDVVYPGLHAEVRLPAFKQRLVPFLNGEVTVVAGDVTTEERTAQEYYRVRIAIDEDQLARLDNVVLRAGMPVEAHIKIGERTFFRYITQPIRDSFHRAFREQ